MSVEPPGAKPLTSVMGRSGRPCAMAGEASAKPSAAPSKIRRIILVSSLEFLCLFGQKIMRNNSNPKPPPHASPTRALTGIFR